MVHRILYFLMAALCCVPMAGANEDDGLAGSDLDSSVQLEADTGLGRYSVGVSGLTDNERLNTTVGDVEFGRSYAVELDDVFPKIAELRPFVFNRVETSTVSYYESLGLGVGVQAGLREKRQDSSIFVRLSMLTPSEYYSERYNLDREFTSIYGVFAGYEAPLNSVIARYGMRQRLLPPPRIIVMKVPSVLFDKDGLADTKWVGRVHLQIMRSYLDRVRAMNQNNTVSPVTDSLALLRLLERVTGDRLSDLDWTLLTTDLIIDEKERAGRRRAILVDALQSRLTAMMRGPHPLVFVPARSTLRPDLSMTAARVSRPGVGNSSKADPLNADLIIANYIAFIIELQP